MTPSSQDSVVICPLRKLVFRAVTQITPCDIMASATFMNPAMLAPFT